MTFFVKAGFELPHITNLGFEISTVSFIVLLPCLAIYYCPIAYLAASLLAFSVLILPPRGRVYAMAGAGMVVLGSAIWWANQWWGS